MILHSPGDLHLRTTVGAPEDLCWTTGDAPDPACAALTDQPRYRVPGGRTCWCRPERDVPRAIRLVGERDHDVRLQFQFVNVPPG